MKVYLVRKQGFDYNDLIGTWSTLEGAKAANAVVTAKGKAARWSGPNKVTSWVGPKREAIGYRRFWTNDLDEYYSRIILEFTVQEEAQGG